jgi:hypothetical protein
MQINCVGLSCKVPSCSTPLRIVKCSGAKKLTYPYSGKQHLFTNYIKPVSIIPSGTVLCHILFTYCSPYASPLQLPCNELFFHSIILFCGLFKTERFHCISILVHRPEHLNYSCRKLAAECQQHRNNNLQTSILCISMY